MKINLSKFVKKQGPVLATKSCGGDRGCGGGDDVAFGGGTDVGAGGGGGADVSGGGFVTGGVICDPPAGGRD